MTNGGPCASFLAMPDGKHTRPRRNLTAPEDGFGLQDKAAKLIGVPWSHWAIAVLEAQAAKDTQEKTEHLKQKRKR